MSRLVHHDPKKGSGNKSRTHRRYSVTTGNGKNGKNGKGGNGGNGGAGGSGGSGGGGWEPKKSDDKPQVRALQKMLGKGKKDGTFERALKIKIGNINRTYGEQSKMLLDDYGKRAAQLRGSRADNAKSVQDASYLNLANRGRERQDLLAQTASQGAGESDTLKSQMQALRNWSANQADVNRSFYDTNRSINSEIVDLNATTRTARANLFNQANTDRGQMYNTYYNQRVDAWTQMGNIQANPQSNAYKKGSPAFDHAADNAGKAYKQPALPKAIKDWKGTIGATEQRLNQASTQAQFDKLEKANTLGNVPPKKPEGASLRKW